MTSTSPRGPVVAAALLALNAAVARAQIDYRNLDDDRPVRVEDAYPVERFAFEFLAPYRLERERSGAEQHAFLPELAFGIVPNGMIGLKLPVAVEREGGTTRWGLSTVRFLALYNFNTESPWLPALSLRTDVVLPAGPLGGDETGVSLKAVATRSFGRNRLHLNGSVTLGGGGTPAALEPVGRWWYGAALDRTLFRHSTLLVAELHASRASDADPVEVNAGLGFRRQMTPVTVLDLGVSRRMRSAVGPELEVTVGLSRAMALRLLMPRGRPRAPAAAGGEHEHHH
jgi:hypothetical protein